MTLRLIKAKGIFQGPWLKQVPGYFTLFTIHKHQPFNKRGKYTPKSPFKRGKYTFPWCVRAEGNSTESILPGRLWLLCRSSAWLDPCIYKSTSWRPGDPCQSNGEETTVTRDRKQSRRDMVFQWGFPPLQRKEDWMISNLSKTHISQKLQLKPVKSMG